MKREYLIRKERFYESERFWQKIVYAGGDAACDGCDFNDGRHDITNNDSCEQAVVEISHDRTAGGDSNGS